MRYELRTTAYDMLDQVCVSTSLYRTPDTPGEPMTQVGHWTSTVLGEGQTDPPTWARDALLAALEDL